MFLAVSISNIQSPYLLLYLHLHKEFPPKPLEATRRMRALLQQLAADFESLRDRLVRASGRSTQYQPFQKSGAPIWYVVYDIESMVKGI